MRSEAPRVDHINSSSSSSSSLSSSNTITTRPKRFSLHAPESTEQADISSLSLYEGGSRRLRRTARAMMFMDYCLHSLCIPCPTKKEKEKEEKKKKKNNNSSNTLLQIRNAGTLYAKGHAMTVLSYLLTIIEDPETTTNTCHRAWMVADTCLPYWQVRNTPELEADTEPLEPIHHEALADYHGIVHAVMFRGDIDPLIVREHTIWKLFPRAGMPRRFSQILSDNISHDHVFRREVTEIVVCSLLGNYPHCSKESRADVPMRAVLYGAFMPVTFHNSIGRAQTEYLTRMVHGNGTALLPLFAMREHLIFVIDDEHVLRKHARILFQYDEFRTIVIEAMAQVRIYIRSNLEPGGTMTEDTIETKLHVDAINRILSTAYRAVVRHAYRKAKPLPFELLKQARGRLPPSLEWGKSRDLKLHYSCGPTSDEKCSATRGRTRIARTNKRKRDKEEEEEEDMGDEEEDDDEKGGGKEDKTKRRKKKNGPDLNEILHSSVDPNIDMDAILQSLNNDNAIPQQQQQQQIDIRDWQPTPFISITTPPPSDSRAITREGIYIEHSLQLCKYIQQIDPSTPGQQAFELITGFLHVFGASKSAITEHIQLATTQHQGQQTLRLWEEKMKMLRDRHPYTYNLIQAAALAWENHVLVRIQPLAHHYIESQTRAIAYRYNIRCETADGIPCQPEVLPEQPCCMAFCRICKRIYSVVRRRPPPPKKQTRRPKPLQTHGYVDVVVDLTTDDIYCRRGRSCMHERCGDTPLTKINMLGNEVQFKGHTYVLCGQPTCGQIALVHPTQTIYTEYGIACYLCSDKIRKQRTVVSTPIQKVREVLFDRRTARKTNKKQRDDTKEGKEGKNNNNNEDEEKKKVTQKGKKEKKAVQSPPPAPRCFLCDRVINSENRLIMYGVDTYVCHRHDKRNELVSFVTTGLGKIGYSSDISDNPQIEVAVRNLLIEFVMINRELFKRAHDRINKENRRREKAAIATKKMLR